MNGFVYIHLAPHFLLLMLRSEKHLFAPMFTFHAYAPGVTTKSPKYEIPDHKCTQYDDFPV